MLTLGMAGHVDHGKTSLTRALTGIETDRLPEEQRRGISIELGFAWLDVPGLERVAIIDMPGHERFVRRMIAGAAGVDALLLVVAADEGVMPQGREHLSVARLLGIQRGAVILTKTDLCDADMRELAREDVRELVAGTFLADAPVWSVSVRDPASVVQLQAELHAFCQALAADPARQADEQRKASRPFRLAVDRAFSLHGRGTIVAGTALTGHVEAEQLLEALPHQQTWRVRSLQRHGETVQRMHAPGRVALNLAGATLADVPLGTVLATPGAVPMTERLDVELTLLPHTKALLNRRRVTIQLGTASAEATVALLDGDTLAAGATTLAQIALLEPLPAWAGQGFVLRGARTDPRHGLTLGGGRVLHPTPERHRRRDAWVLAALGRLAGMAAEAQVQGALQLAHGRGLTEDALLSLCTARVQDVHKALKTLSGSGVVRRAGHPSRWFFQADLDAIAAAVLAALRTFHQQHPTRQGPELAELCALAVPWQATDVVADVVQLRQRDGQLAIRGTAVHLPGFEPAAQVSEALVTDLLALLAPQGLAPETPAQLAVLLGQSPRLTIAALNAALTAGQVTRITEDYWVLATHATDATARVLATFVDVPTFTTGELKDVLGLTRKHLIPFAEWLDAQKVSVRDVGGNRRIREKAREAWHQRRSTPATDLPPA